MTNQEAIDLLDNLIGMIEDNHGSDYDSAIRMAIDVLKNQPEIIKCKYCKHWHNAPSSDGYNSCEKDALIRHESFFCADAKLRGDSDEVHN